MDAVGPPSPSSAAALLPRLTMAVIHGGDKRHPGAVLYPSNNPRSWKSYEAVAHDIAGTLERIGVRRVEVLPDDMRLAQRLARDPVHLAWLNTAGTQGYNSTCHAPALLEMLGLPYVGHNSLNTSLLDNKHVFKRTLLGVGLPTAPFMTWAPEEGLLDPDRAPRFACAFGASEGPFVVKPVAGRASLHVHVVGRDRLAERVDDVGRVTGNLVLIEPFLPGPEFCVSVAGPVIARGGALYRGEGAFAFSVLERMLGPDELIFTSMDVRPITDDRWRLVEEAGLLAELRRLALEVHGAFNLETLVRLDLRADREGRLMILEANPKPDLKRPRGNEGSLVCAGLAAEGMDYDDLIRSLLIGRIDFLLRHRRAAAGLLTELTDG